MKNPGIIDIIETTSEMVFSVGPDHGINFANAAFKNFIRELNGIENKSGLNLADFLKGENLQLFKENLRKAFGGKEKTALQIDFLQKSRVKHIEFTFTPLANESSNISEILVCGKEIDPNPDNIEGNKIDYFKTIVENSPDHYIIADKNGEVIFLSPAMDFLLGYGPGVLLKRNIFEMVDPGDVDEFYRNYSRAFHTKNLSSNASFITAGGDWMKFSVRFSGFAGSTSKQSVILVLQECEKETVDEFIFFERDFYKSAFTGINPEQLIDTLERKTESLGEERFRCAFMHYNESSHSLRMNSGASFSNRFTEYINSDPLKFGFGAFGICVAFKEPVMVEDIERHVYWKTGKETALREGIKSEFSFPVCLKNGSLAGIFTCFYNRPGKITDHDLELMKRGVELLKILFEGAEKSAFAGKNKDKDIAINKKYSDLTEAIPEKKEQARAIPDLSSILENTAGKILEVDMEGRIKYVNFSEGRQNGFNGESFFDILPENEKEKVKTVFQNVFEKGELQEYELNAVVDGKNTWFFNRMNPVWENGRVVAANIISTDITRIKLKHEEFLKLNYPPQNLHRNEKY